MDQLKYRTLKLCIVMLNARNFKFVNEIKPSYLQYNICQYTGEIDWALHGSKCNLNFVNNEYVGITIDGKFHQAHKKYNLAYSQEIRENRQKYGRAFALLRDLEKDGIVIRNKW